VYRLATFAAVIVTTAGVGIACMLLPAPPSACGTPPNSADAASGVAIDLAQQLGAGGLRAVNREVTALEGSSTGVYVSNGSGSGVVWIEDLDLAEGTIDIDVCGRDAAQRSFLGIAFHRQDDETYEAVYLRPFHFRADDAVRHQHAVPYIAVPDHDWPQLRESSPEEFENPVDASIDPIAWIPLRVVVDAQRVQVFVGAVASPTLDVPRLGEGDAGLVGLWVGNFSDGGFANLRITRPESPQTES